ncbi:MAG: hypothetical protein ABIQ31_16145 [Ferruginibacter sp.]
MPSEKIKLEKVKSEIDAESENPTVLKTEMEELDKKYIHLLQMQKVKALEVYNSTASQNISERKKYATMIFRLTVGWTIAIFFVIILNGFNLYCFYISDKVLITLITTTTINFLGFFLLVTKYLFNTKETESGLPFNDSENLKK